MNTSLETQLSPVAIADGFVKKAETSIVMQYHDNIEGAPVAEIQMTGATMVSIALTRAFGGLELLAG